jgi:hypothetical protein
MCEQVMRGLLRYCFRHTATLLSLSKLHLDLTSQGFAIGRNTLFDHFAKLQDSGLIFLLPVHSESVRKQARNPRKLHVVDPGLVSAYKAGADRDVGRKLETAVFLQARRRAREWHYVAGDRELDLCDTEGEMFVNSCWRLVDESTIEREARAMEFGRAMLPEAEGGTALPRCRARHRAPHPGGEAGMALVARAADPSPRLRWRGVRSEGGPRDHRGCVCRRSTVRQGVKQAVAAL